VFVRICDIFFILRIFSCLFYLFIFLTVFFRIRGIYFLLRIFYVYFTYLIYFFIFQLQVEHKMNDVSHRKKLKIDTLSLMLSFEDNRWF